MPSLMGGFKNILKQGANVLDIFNLITSKTDADSTKNDPDEKWSNLYRERQRNHLYKWVDVNKGGELLDLYDKDGEDGIVRFANEKIAPLLFNDGTLVEKIRFSEYVKWKKALDANISGGVEDSDEDVEAMQKKFADHTAQWKLTKRGVDGETVIHLLLGRDDAKCTEIAIILVRLFPGLAIDIYEGDEFYGQSPLHLAIVHDDYEMVTALMEAGADIKCRATGRFFLPEDQKRTVKAKQTNYIGFAYYGEYPLAFAASFGNKDIYDYLIQNGADPNAQDSFGNTVLHICVINNSIEMYSYAVRHWSKPADTDICNFAGYTPLTLATILGRREIFEAMLELTKMEFWRFSDMACSAYPLTTLDTIRPDGSTNWDSALMRVVNGSTANHMDIVGSDVIQRLLADKWRSFGHKKMYQRLILLIIHLLILSASIYARPEDAQDLWGRHSVADIIRYVLECALLFSCTAFLIYQQGSEIQAQGLGGYLKMLVRAPDKILFLISNILILACVPCRMTEQYTMEETLLALALPGSWTYLLFFAKGYLLTGPFVIMIYKMISGDMLRFGVISLIFLVSFSQAFYFLGKDMRERQLAGNWCNVSIDDHLIVDYEQYSETALTLFRMSMGGYDYEEFDCASYKGFTKILFVIYMIIMPIMLINMLIAMMGNTYTTIISQAEKAWFQQWAQLVILLERALDKRKLVKYQTEYSIKLNDDRFDQDGQGGMETRALMVIKQTKKTRAKQRKQATASWKRLGRKVLAMIRNHGTERSRDVLHSHGQILPSMIISRPMSAAGMRPEHAQMLSNIQNQILTSPGRRTSNTSSLAVQQSIKVTHVVDTMKNAALPHPPLERASPQLLVHRPPPTSNSPNVRFPNIGSAISRSSTLQNQLSVDHRVSFDVITAITTQSPSSQTISTPHTQRQSLEREPQTLEVAANISSPNTPGSSDSGHGPAGGKKKPRPDDTSSADLLRKASAQLQSLSVEQLPTTYHRSRKPLVAQIRKRNQDVGCSIPQPNMPSVLSDHKLTLESAPTDVADRHSSASVLFLTQTGVTQLPNIPLHEKGAQTLVGDEETTSFHEDELDTSLTSGVVLPRRTNSASVPRKLAASPTAVIKDATAKKPGGSLQGKRTKKK